MGFETLALDRGLDRYAANLIRRKARSLIGKFGYSPTDVEEIEQDLACDLVQRFSKYDATKSSRTTFARDIILKKVASMVRYRRAQCRRLDRRPLSLSDSVAVGREAVERLRSVDDAICRHHSQQRGRSDQSLLELRLDMREALRDLPEKLREFGQLLCELPVREVADRLRISRPTATKNKIAILEILRRKNFEKYL